MKNFVATIILILSAFLSSVATAQTVMKCTGVSDHTFTGRNGHQNVMSSNVRAVTEISYNKDYEWFKISGWTDAQIPDFSSENRNVGTVNLRFETERIEGSFRHRSGGLSARFTLINNSQLYVQRSQNGHVRSFKGSCVKEAKPQAQTQTQERQVAEVQRQREGESRQRENTSQGSAEQWLKRVDGNWVSKQWKYGYQLKNGVGTATSTNSPNFQIGQTIIHLTAKSATTFVGRQIYTDGKFYNVNVSLQPDGRLYFEGEKNAKWYMEKVKEKITTKVDLFFTADQTALTPEGKKLLDQVAAFARRMELDSIVLQGYSALIDTETVSLNISRLRAISAKAYLVSQGIDTNRIFVDARGIQNAIGDNNTPAGRAKNNRVNIDIIGYKK